MGMFGVVLGAVLALVARICAHGFLVGTRDLV